MRLILISFIAAFALCYSWIFFTDTSNNKTVTRGMYYWKTQLYINDYDERFIKNHDISKLYTKIMDIDWHAVYGAYPTTANDIEREFSRDSLTEIIPVIFLTNESILQTPNENIDTLGKKLVLKAAKLCGHGFNEVKELQLDCDWTPKSKEKYFKLIEVVKKQLNGRKLSVTLRLHQLKNKKITGIPPADRVMLMLYNMGKLSRYNEPNSILNISETKKYLAGSRYSLPMDFALPIFNWGIRFSNKRFDGIIHRVNRETFDTCKAFVKQKNGLYHTVADYYTIDDNYFYNGDEIRIEDVSKEDLLKLPSMCKNISNSKKFCVSFFELNTYYVSKIDSASYEEIYNSFN